MRAGPMRYKLRLLEPVTTKDGFNANHTTYVDRGVVNAERVKSIGRKSMEVGEAFPDYTVQFRIRDAHHVLENWRVEQLGGYTYTVNNIIPFRELGMLQLDCERVNE